MSELGKLIQAYIDSQVYPPTDSAVARKLGVSRSALGKWKRGDAMPSPDNLRAIATLLGVGYMRVLDAALIDDGYLPKDGDGDVRDAAPMTPGVVATPMPDHARRRQT